MHQHFATSDVAEAMRLLKTAVLHDGKAPDHRMLRCAVVASEKSLRSLKHYVAGLAVDFRDVIVAGEYESRNGELVQVRDLSKPIEP